MIAKYWKKIVSVFVILGAVGAYIGNFNNYAIVVDMFDSTMSTENQIHGIWLSKYNYPVTGGTLEVEGTTEYFKNNTYNFTGRIGLKVSVKDHKIEALYNVDGVGDWQSDTDSLTVKLNEIHSWPETLSYNGHLLDTRSPKKGLTTNLPKIEDVLPKGTSDDFKIVKIVGDSMLLETDAPNGEKFSILALRQTEKFQRQPL